MTRKFDEVDEKYQELEVLNVKGEKESVRKVYDELLELLYEPVLSDDSRTLYFRVFDFIYCQSSDMIEDNALTYDGDLRTTFYKRGFE